MRTPAPRGLTAALMQFAAALGIARRSAQLRLGLGCAALQGAVAAAPVRWLRPIPSPSPAAGPDGGGCVALHRQSEQTGDDRRSCTVCNWHKSTGVLCIRRLYSELLLSSFARSSSVSSESRTPLLRSTSGKVEGSSLVDRRSRRIFSDSMGKFVQVLVLEVESAKDKSKESEGGKYRRDTPWLVEAFVKKGVKSSILFITNADTAESLVAKYPSTAFLGRVNPMDYPEIKLEEYVKMLNGLKDAGVLLGPDAEHMDRLGSKMILYELRDTSMGIDGVLLHQFADLQRNDGEIDTIIPVGSPPRVLKMLRGSTGLGVWKLENSAGGGKVLLTDAYTQTTDEIPRNDVIPKFLALCQEDAISMPFLPLIKDGEFRFLMSRHAVLEVVHKRPVDESAFTATLRSGAVYTTIDLVEHKGMVDAVVQWSYDIKKTLGLADVPYWWSVDCIEEAVGDAGLKPEHIPSGNPGRRLVLSEINCSCLGLVADTSAEAKAKGMRFADMIADIVLKD